MSHPSRPIHHHTTRGPLPRIRRTFPQLSQLLPIQALHKAHGHIHSLWSLADCCLSCKFWAVDYILPILCMRLVFLPVHLPFFVFDPCLAFWLFSGYVSDITVNSVYDPGLFIVIEAWISELYILLINLQEMSEDHSLHKSYTIECKFNMAMLSVVWLTRWACLKHRAFLILLLVGCAVRVT